MMPLTKRIADTITWVRLLLSPLFIWLGFSRGQESLPFVASLMILEWTSDSVDGMLARRNPVQHQSWIGSRDLEIDILVACGLLVYLAVSGLLAWPIALFYLLIWGFYFVLAGFPRSSGMLFQAPIYAWFVVVTFREATLFGWLMVLWIGVAIAVTWPKFPKVMVPGFLGGMRSFWQRRSAR